MSQVSKRKLKKEDFEKIYDQMIKIFSKTGSKKDSGKFLRESLYTTEKIMLAKRLALIFMIIEKIPDRKIAEMLSVSTSTVGKFIDKFNAGDFNYISSLIIKNKKSFWDIIWEFYFLPLSTHLLGWEWQDTDGLKMLRKNTILSKILDGYFNFCNS